MPTRLNWIESGARASFSSGGGTSIHGEPFSRPAT